MVNKTEGEMDQGLGRVRGEALKLQWRARLDRFAGAKQSVRVFCAAESVSEPAFFHWRKRLSGQAEAAPQRVRVRKRAVGFVDAGVARVRPAPMPGGSLMAPLAGGLEVQIDLGAGVMLRILRR